MQPVDKTNADDVTAAKAIQAAFAGCSTWDTGIAHLLTATLWPVAVVEKVYQPTPTGYALAELVPVDPQLLDFTTGWLMIRKTDPVTNFPTSELMAPDPNRYIVHHGHLLPTPDHWGGPVDAGNVVGPLPLRLNNFALVLDTPTFYLPSIVGSGS